MGILDLFKGLFKEKKVEEVVIEKLAFSDVGGWIENKIKENELKEKEIISVIRNKIKKHSNELNQKTKILGDFDVESKKVEDRLKSVVNESRKKYIEFLEIFIADLNNIEKEKLEEFISYVNKVFLDFNKKSHMNYQKTTILIGKEAGGVKDSLKDFSKELGGVFDENKKIVDSFKKTFLIKSKLTLILSIDRTLEKIGETIPDLNEEIKGKEEESKNFSEEIEKIKKSPDYLERLRTQKKIEFLKEELKNDIFGLKQTLDFKALANFYHSFEREMNVIKEYKEDFRQAFQKDSGKNILGLLDEAKLNDETTSQKVNLIRTKLEKTSTYEKEIKEDETKGLYPKIKEVKLEIDGLKIEKVKEEKRQEKLKIGQEEMMDSLKKELGGMNVEVISSEQISQISREDGCSKK
ncbi:MAG TPA: hypothetical protein ENH99_00005 [Candidatus Pacearchaeota archaeon]|nr:hypothetical protein [Candidatus Pacearchaeota archaeon]